MRGRVAVAGSLLFTAGVAWFVLRASERAPAGSEAPAPGGEAARSTLSPRTAATGDPAREAAEPGAARTRLRGRVLTEAGEPLAGASFQLAFLDEEALAETESDGEGRFELEFPPREGLTLATIGPDEWELTPESLELDRAPEEELEFVARLVHVPRGIVRGVLVDELTDEPLPYLRVAFADEFSDEVVESDAHGRFVSREEHEQGTLEFFFPEVELELDFDPASEEPLVVPARVGPALYVEPSSRPEELQVYWIPEGTGPEVRDVRGTRLRNDVPTIVRLPTLAPGETVRGDLVALSDPEFLCGRATITEGSGTPANPLPIELRPCGLVQLGRNGLYEYDDVVIRVQPPPGGEWLSCSSGGGLAVFTPGEHEVEVVCDGQKGRARFQAELGEAVIVDLTWERWNPPEKHEELEDDAHLLAVHVRVFSRRNRPTPGDFGLLDEQRGVWEPGELEWTKERGRWSAEATVRVAPGEYEVRFQLEPRFGVEGPTRVTVPSAVEPTFTILDDVVRRDVYLDVVDPDTGQPLRAFEYELMEATYGWDWVGSNDYHSPTRPAVRQHPSNVPILWLVRAPGRQSACGRLELAAEEGDFHLEVPLPKGWGVTLSVSGPNGEPLEGVEIYFDGRLAGRTQRNGECALGAREPPQRIELRYRDWSLYPLDSDLGLDGTYAATEAILGASLLPGR